MSYQCLNRERRMYLKEDSAKAVSTTQKIIFDFDGVLVYTIQSYRQAIRKVVDYYFLQILGLPGKEGKLVTLGDIQKSKDTGLYNNDWNLSYALITYYLAITMRRLQRRGLLQDFTRQFGDVQFTDVGSFLHTLGEVGSFLRRHGTDAAELVNVKNGDVLGLESFLAQMDLKSQNPLQTALPLVSPQVGSEQLTLVKRLVPYDLEKPDLLRRLFEELYLGKELFGQFHGIPSVFKFKESFLEKEKFIPTRKILDVLHQRFGEFAIYSEKPRVQGLYLLEKNDLEEYFDEGNFIFLDDIVESEMSRKGVRLDKPHPALFIQLIEKFAGKDTWVAYVGDSVADAMLVENARLKGLSNLVFLGVLCSSHHPNQLLFQYFKHEADAVMTDINDIPSLLAMLGGKI